jgi:hypothetical protein
MNSISTAPARTVDDIARETGFSIEAVRLMADALADGGGTMAQFDHPDFGGNGQWMRGGMVMAGAFGDHALKARIDRLCTLLAGQPVAQRAGMTHGAQHQSQSSGAPVERERGVWWGADLGRPDVTGAQDDVRYAWFAQSRRLAIDQGGHVTLYDTGDHRIGGASQQQGGVSGLSFTSQHGPIALDRLKVVPGATQHVSHATRPAQPSSNNDPFAAIERLAELRARGVIDDDEFRAKKAELLARI